MKTARLLSLILSIVMLATAFLGCAKEYEDHDRDDDRPSTNQSNRPHNGGTQQTATLVAEELDVSAATALPPAVLPDLYHWSGKTMKYKNEPSSDSECQHIEYYAQMDTILAYIEMLKANGFTLVGEYVGYQQAMYYWSLVCDTAADIPMITDVITEADCHVSIGWSNKSRTTFTFRVSRDLPVTDTGSRMDGSVEDLMFTGPSLGTGLIKNPDGSYSTTDGRLSTCASSATILRDGVSYSAPVTYDEKYEKQHVYVEEFYLNEYLYLQFPTNSLSAGNLFSHLQMRDWLLTEHDDHGEDVFVYDAPFTMFVFHGGMMRRPSYNDEYFETTCARVMYYEKGKEAVFYLYGKMRGSGEPKEIEALIAVDMSKTLSQNTQNDQSQGGSSSEVPGGNDIYVPKLDCLTCRGSGDCTSCGGSGYTYFGDYKTACTRCHRSGNCSSCNGTGKR